MSGTESTGQTSRAVTPESTSTSLLRRVRTEDPAAWERLVDLYAPLIYRWCRNSGLRSEDAGDVVQEVFRSVFAAVDGFRGDREGSFRAWLRSITRHRIADHLRGREDSPEGKGGTAAHERFQQIPDIIDPSASDATSADEDDGFWRRSLELVRAEFEGRTWQAFWRVAVDGQRPADVAAELEMTRHAVYKAKSRVLLRLREELGELEGDL